MNNKKSLAVYFSVIVLLVVLTYGLKSTFAYFVANEKGTATDVKVAKLSYDLTSADLNNNSITIKPYEVKKINILLKSNYEVATIYRLQYEGNVTVQTASTSLKEAKSIIDSKATNSIDLVITNNTNEEQNVKFFADGGYVGNDLENGNISTVYDETLLQNKLLINGTLTLTDLNDYRDLTGTNNYVSIDNIIYRVLGISKIDDKNYLKLITNESIGSHMFGETNNYLTSSLNTYLNVDYKEALINTLKDNLKEVTYYTAGIDKVLENNKDYYNYERGNALAQEGFNASGPSTIGLMYLSDYIYAENWLKTNVTEYTIVPNTSDATKVFCITYTEDNSTEESAGINSISSDCSVNEEQNVRPVMYVDNKLVIESGTGTVNDPYIIK